MLAIKPNISTNALLNMKTWLSVNTLWKLMGNYSANNPEESQICNFKSAKPSLNARYMRCSSQRNQSKLEH